jgi:Fe2+ or Zn2+ uptake regulation protein
MTAQSGRSTDSFITDNLAQEWLTRLKDNGYRLTTPRSVVVKTIASSDHVLNPFEVFELARNDYPGLGLVTVYRTLEKLEELNLIQRVHQPSGCQSFVVAHPGHQHILICENCGRVDFFREDPEGINILMKEVGGDSGFEITNHWLQFFGICNDCQGP